MNYKAEVKDYLDALERHIMRKKYEIRNMRRQKEEWMGFLSICQAFCTEARKKLGSGESDAIKLVLQLISEMQDEKTN